MSEKIISLQRYKHAQRFKKIKENKKMLFLAIVVGALTGLFAWNYFIESVDALNVQIPQSKNITFNNDTPLAMTTAQIANEFENADGKPILLYIYTTWCKVCGKNFATINEIAREFQNSDLHFIALAIDRKMAPEELSSYLNNFGDVYFQPKFLVFKDGFLEFLEKQQIHYNGRVPFTVLIGRDGEVVTKFSGSKNKSFLRKKILQQLAA